MTRTVWEEGREPGREMAALGVALALTVACLDLSITGRISLLFDVGFVLLCVGLALAVRPHDFFTVGVLPPLLMLTTFLLLAMSQSQAIASAHDGLVQAVLTGLSHHALALFFGYVACLGVLHTRLRVVRQRESDAEQDVRRTDPGRRLPV